MEGSSRSIVGGDSQETQPPEIPLEDPVTPCTRVRLVPNTDHWFGDREVARVISDAIRTYYRSPFTCFRETPEDHKRFWWNCFKKRFVWDPKCEELVKREWQQKVRIRVKDLVYKVGKQHPDKIVTWMAEDLRGSVKNKRETDEDFKKRSEQCKRNKTEGPKAKIGHYQGSISSSMWAARLTKQLSRRPSAAELFVAMHSKVDASGERSWCDAHAQSVYEKYEQLKADTDVQGASVADDHLFLKACGGWTQKGTIYGLRREGPAMYERSTTSRRSLCRTSSAYSTPVVAQLQDQLQTTQSELQTTQSELQTTRNELQMTRNELQTTQARLHATEEELQSTRKQLEDQRLGLLELNARFESFSALLGHPTRTSNSRSSS